MRKVVITGMGAVSPFGVGVQPLIDNLYAGNSAVKNLHEEWHQKITDLNCRLGAPLPEPLDVKAVPRKIRRTMGPTAMMAYIATEEALQQANLQENDVASARTGVSFSSTIGSALSMEEVFADYFETSSIAQLSSGITFQFMSHTSAMNIAQAWDIKGRVISPNAACASSTQAIGIAYEMIRSGQQDIMVCGGSDELHVVVSAFFDLINACSCHFNDEPTKTPRPFDKDRDGTICGEGAGTVILETEESARARGAPILAEIIGFATGTGGKNPATSSTESIQLCLRSALESAGITPDTVDYINAHATGTETGDKAEASAIGEVFGNNDVRVSSFKGYMGHTQGASGVLELIACVLMTNDNTIIPTRNLDVPGEGCKNIQHVTSLLSSPVKIFLKNSCAFGGINTVLVVKRYQ